MSVNRAKNSALMMLTLGQEMETTNNKYNRKVIHVVFYKVRRATDKETRRASGDFRCGLKGSRLNVKWQSKRVCGAEGSRASRQLDFTHPNSFSKLNNTHLVFGK